MAGHRDGFFRALKDIALGDTIELTTTGGSFPYAVDELEIVTPADVRVLKPRGRPSVTLVTCYPFYFVGDAPQRFIVHASMQQPKGGELQEKAPSAQSIQFKKEKGK
jgi:sortase A